MVKRANTVADQGRADQAGAPGGGGLRDRAGPWAWRSAGARSPTARRRSGDTVTVLGATASADMDAPAGEVEPLGEGPVGRGRWASWAPAARDEARRRGDYRRRRRHPAPSCKTPAGSWRTPRPSTVIRRLRQDTPPVPHPASCTQPILRLLKAMVGNVTAGRLSGGHGDGGGRGVPSRTAEVPRSAPLTAVLDGTGAGRCPDRRRPEPRSEPDLAGRTTPIPITPRSEQGGAARRWRGVAPRAACCVWSRPGSPGRSTAPGRTCSPSFSTVRVADGRLGDSSWPGRAPRLQVGQLPECLRHLGPAGLAVRHVRLQLGRLSRRELVVDEVVQVAFAGAQADPTPDRGRRPAIPTPAVATETGAGHGEREDGAEGRTVQFVHLGQPQGSPLLDRQLPQRRGYRRLRLPDLGFSAPRVRLMREGWRR